MSSSFIKVLNLRVQANKTKGGRRLGYGLSSELILSWEWAESKLDNKKSFYTKKMNVPTF